MTDHVRSILKKELKPGLGIDRSSWISGLSFVIVLIVFEAFYFSSSTSKAVAHFINDFDLIGKLIFAVYLATAFYLLLLFVVTVFSSKWALRLVFVALFSLALVVEYSYQNALGRFTNYYDVIAAMSATNDQKLDSIWAFVSFVPIFPGPMLLLISTAIPVKRQRFGWKLPLGVFVVSAIFYVHLSYVKAGLFDGEFPNSSFGFFCETMSDFAIQNPIEQLSPIKRREVAVPSNRNAPDNNVIVIFDESIRADHLSLNGYERPTTPFLKELEQKQLLLSWGTAAAAATSSHPSYDAFITGAQPDQLEKMSLRELNSMPTLFQYAKSMNYKTIMFDGQMMKYWGGAADDLNYIDEFDSLASIDRPDRIEDWQSASNRITDESQRKDGLKQWEIDARIAEMVNRIFTSSTGNFIFIYKRGCHFPYEKNFPPSETVWKPVYHFQEQYEIPPADKRDAIINAYDDSLRYNLDEFFRKLAPDYSSLANHTVIIYTGDHGESFYANGKAGHGGDTPEEAEVPLFILGLKETSVDLSFKASHHNVFATLLDLMNYPSELRNGEYSVSLLKAASKDSRPRFFNPSPGKKVRFDQ